MLKLLRISGYQKFIAIATVTTILVLGMPQIAMAYVGPGAGLSLLTALLGLIGAILTALGIIFFWPIKMLIQRLMGKSEDEEDEEVDNDSEDEKDSQVHNYAEDEEDSQVHNYAEDEEDSDLNRA